MTREEMFWYGVSQAWLIAAVLSPPKSGRSAFAGVMAILAMIGWLIS